MFIIFWFCAFRDRLISFESEPPSQIQWSVLFFSCFFLPRHECETFVFFSHLPGHLDLKPLFGPPNPHEKPYLKRLVDTVSQLPPSQSLKASLIKSKPMVRSARSGMVPTPTGSKGRCGVSRRRSWRCNEALWGCDCNVPKLLRNC